MTYRVARTTIAEALTHSVASAKNSTSVAILRTAMFVAPQFHHPFYYPTSGIETVSSPLIKTLASETRLGGDPSPQVGVARIKLLPMDQIRPRTARLKSQEKKITAAVHQRKIVQQERPPRIHGEPVISQRESLTGSLASKKVGPCVKTIFCGRRLVLEPSDTSLDSIQEE